MNGDPSVQVVLTEAGRDQARALGARLVDLVAHRPGRTRETAELAWPGTPLLEVPELGEFTFGSFEGSRWRTGSTPGSKRPRPTWGRRAGASRVEAARRFVRGYRTPLDRPEDRAASHGAPVAYILLALGVESRPSVSSRESSKRVRSRSRPRPWPGRSSHRRLGFVADVLGHTLHAGPGRSLHPRADLIEPGGEVTVLVSGGADSTCLWHVLRELGYRVSALHVDHGSAAPSRTRTRASAATRSAPRWSTGREPPRPSCAMRATRSRPNALRATGHTASDQVESVLLGLVASGSPQRIKAKREDGVVRPLLGSGARRRGLTVTSAGSRTARTRPTRTRSAA